MRITKKSGDVEFFGNLFPAQCFEAEDGNLYIRISLDSRNAVRLKDATLMSFHNDAPVYPADVEVVYRTR